MTPPLKDSAPGLAKAIVDDWDCYVCTSGSCLTIQRLIAYARQTDKALEEIERVAEGIEDSHLTPDQRTSHAAYIVCAARAARLRKAP